MHKIFSEQKWESLTLLWRKKEADKQVPLDYKDPEVRELMRAQFQIRRAMKSTLRHKYNLSITWEKVAKRSRKARQQHIRKRYFKYAAFATLFIVLSAILTDRIHKDTTFSPTQTNEAILPGIQKAELILANGERIALDSCKKVREIKEIGVRLVHDSLSGSLLYQTAENKSSGRKTEFNTLNVPKGGEYIMQLPDGSTVWLNAESSLRFPVQFADNKREVYLQGEAFFKIAKNASAPFHVYAGKNDIQALGTQFNVSAYADDRMWHTTLVEGKVSINKNIIMNPAEQYCEDQQTGRVNLNSVDPDLYTSWVEGKFYFQGFTFEEIVKKLERWYDFNMLYQNESIRKMRFSGTINKHRPLEEMLHFLEKTTNIHFNILGKTITANKI